MKEVKIYTTQYCPHCRRAKELLKAKNIPFKEVDITHDSAARAKLEAQTGWMTVPMIFIGDELIGGAQELDQLIQAGELDKKLKSLT